MTAVVAPKFGSRILMAINKQNNRHTIPPQTHISFIMPYFKGIGSRHKSGTGNNQGRQQIVITGALIATTVTQRATSFHYRWYLFLLHWIIQSSIYLRYTRFVNSNPDLHISLLVITVALIARTVTQRAMIFHHRWYLCLLHLMIQSLIQLSFPSFVNSHPDLHITQRMSCNLLQYPVGLHLIRQIPYHRRPPIMVVTIFMDAWLMCLSWYWHSDNILEKHGDRKSVVFL